MTIAFDVDDTLIVPPLGDIGTPRGLDLPNYDTIAVYKWFQKQGNTMVVWSGGGVDYARMWAEKLGLMPDHIWVKEKNPQVDIAFDDCDVDLGTVNVKVRRTKNSIKRSHGAIH